MSIDTDLSKKALSANVFTGRLPLELFEDRFQFPSAFAGVDLQPFENIQRFPDLYVTLHGDFFQTHKEWSSDIGVVYFASAEEPTSLLRETDEYFELLELWAWLARDLLNKFAPRLQRDVYETLQGRLQILLDPDEWNAGETLPNSQSYHAMLSFLRQHPEFQAPFVALLRTGHFEVSWRAASDELTVLEFRSDGMVDWLVFAPAGPGTRQKERAAGTSPFDVVLDRIRGYGTLNWMNRAEKQAK